MPTLFLMCGLPGSGKTTLAKQIEQEKSALRLTPDEWIARLDINAYDETKRAVIEAIQWDVAARALSLGTNVILDFGFWSKQERDDMCRKASELGADTKVCFLDIPHEELLRRLRERNKALPHGVFHVSEEQLVLWSGWFEPPTEEELSHGH